VSDLSAELTKLQCLDVENVSAMTDEIAAHTISGTIAFLTCGFRWYVLLARILGRNYLSHAFLPLASGEGLNQGPNDEKFWSPMKMRPVF